MLHDGSIVVEQQVLPVGTETCNLVTVGISQIVGISIERSLSTVHVLLILQDGIVCGASHLALSPGTLPTITEVIVDLSLTHLTLLGSHQNHTVGSTGSVDGT